MSRFTLRIVLLFFCYIPFQLIAQKKFSGKPVDRSKAVSLSKVFKKYSLFSIPTTNLNQYTKAGGKQTLHLELDLPGYAQWQITIHETDLLAEDYQAYTGTGTGRRALPLSDIRTYSGSLDNEAANSVFLTISGKTIHGFLRTKRNNYNIEPLWYFDAQADAGTFVVYEAEDVIPNSDQTCGLTEAVEKSGTVASGFSTGQMQTLGSATGDCLMVEMAIASDATMFQKYRSYEAVEEHNISILNMMAGIYSNAQIGTSYLDFKLKGQYISPDVSEDPFSVYYIETLGDNLLTYFSEWSNSGGFGFDFDLGQVWTARDFSVTGGSSSAVGLAYMGSVCHPNKRFQLLEDTYSTSLVQAIVAAHETGHNFNASHDGSTAYIMFPSINTNNPPTIFSSTSLTEMNTYLTGATAPTCLSACEINPPRVDFTVSTTAACIGNAISFKNITPDAMDQVLWSFPGGTPSSSAAAAPTVSFATAGKKTVTLTVSNANGTSTKTKEILVLPPPVTACENIYPGNTEQTIIYSFALEGIQHTTSPLTIGGSYSDFSCTYNTQLKPSTVYRVTTRMGMTSSAYNSVQILIDYNNDGDFLDPFENVARPETCIDGTYSFEIGTPPAGYPLMNTMLRLRLIAMPCGAAPTGGCDYPSNAQIEDYGVYFTEGCGEPKQFSLTGDCYNKPLQLSGSETGVSYQLINTNTNSLVGLPLAGTGTALDFGNQPVGNYIVRATNACGTYTMGGTQRVKGQPTAFDVTTDGICTYQGIRLSGTEKGVYYSLVNESGITISRVEGDGNPLFLGVSNQDGTYTFIAENACTKVNMNGSVVKVAPPQAFNVSGGYCVGDFLSLDGSQAGVSYQLEWNNGTAYVPLGTPVIGTGGPITVGRKEEMGNYLIKATNACRTSVMNGFALSYANIAWIPSSSTINVSGTRKEFFYAGNCELIATVLPNGGNPVNGSVAARVWMESTVPEFAGRPFVTRHYEITPQFNAATASGRVTLYFTQNEFNAYNNSPNAILKLPAYATDAAGIANLKIEKFAGTSNNGTGLPGSYTSGSVLIDPNDADIRFNGPMNAWEVSFEVDGFSGFIVHTNVFPLPLKLISFQASRLNNNVVLTWQTSLETDVSHFEIERSANGVTYNTIGKLGARNAAGIQQYRYTDQDVMTGFAGGAIIYYRLKMVDINTRFEYSPVRRVVADGSFTASIYPNPVHNMVTVRMPDGRKSNLQLRLTDMHGRVVKSWLYPNAGSSLQLNVQEVPPGVYQLEISQGEGERIVFKMVKL